MLNEKIKTKVNNIWEKKSLISYTQLTSNYKGLLGSTAVIKLHSNCGPCKYCWNVW